MSSNQAGSNDSDRRSRIIRGTISVVSGCFVCALGAALFWKKIRVALKPVPDDLGWFWGALIAAGIFLLVALFVYFVAKRTLWELAGLLIVPLALAAIGLWFTAQQDARQQQIENQRTQQTQKLENQRAEDELALQQQNAQDEALQAYLDQMSQLMLENNLRDADQDSEVRRLAEARTLTVLGSLVDSQRKWTVLRFLYQSELILYKKPVIRLASADLTETNFNVNLGTTASLPKVNFDGAYLRESQLKEANLAHAYMRRTKLAEAQLEGADLKGADLTGAEVGSTKGWKSVGKSLGGFETADLSGADLSGATLTEAFLHKVDMSPLQWGGREERTDLSDAKLRYAIMDEANLRGTILDGADFTCAALGKADFTGATGIKWKQLEEQALTLSGATKPNGTIYVQQQPPPLGSCPGP